MSNILALDTSGSTAGCAVMQDGVIRAALTMNIGLTHSETILPAVDDIMSYAGLRAQDLDCVATVAGPGSFTGVRIGVCLAKGIAHAAKIVCAGVDALEVLARNFYGFDGIVCPILDARRDQVYTAQFSVSPEKVHRLSEDQALSVNDLCAFFPEGQRILFTGDAIPRQREILKSILGDRAFFAPAHLCQISASAAAVIAHASPETWIPAERLTPIYLRKPQAERQREARL